MRSTDNPVLTSADNPCFIPPMAHATNELLTGLLKSVSRSFYSTLRILPPAIRPQIGLAYLLARMTDTVADSDTRQSDGPPARACCATATSRVTIRKRVVRIGLTRRGAQAARSMLKATRTTTMVRAVFILVLLLNNWKIDTNSN